MKTPCSLLLLSTFVTLPLDALAAPPSLQTAQHAVTHHFRSLFLQKVAKRFSQRDYARNRGFAQHDQFRRIFRWAKDYGSSVPLGDDMRADLLHAMTSIATDLQQPRVIGGARTLKQIYRGLARVGLQSVTHHREGAQRVARHNSSPRIQRVAATADLTEAQSIVSAINPKLLKTTELRALNQAHQDLGTLRSLAHNAARAERGSH